MADLKVGDHIQCAGEKDMIEVSCELFKEGIATDWLDIHEQPPLKWRLTVTQIMED